MKKVFGGIAASIIFIFLCTSGWLEDMASFFAWLVTLKVTQSSVSPAGEAFVKGAAFVIAYVVVGLIFKAIGWFDSGAMKIAYFIISTLISFALCYAVMIFETHLALFEIIFGVILAAVIAFFIVVGILNRKKVKMENGRNEHQ